MVHKKICLFVLIIVTIESIIGDRGDFMYGYTKIAMAVTKTSLADTKGNLQDIKEKIRKAVK